MLLPLHWCRDDKEQSLMWLLDPKDVGKKDTWRRQPTFTRRYGFDIPVEVTFEECLCLDRVEQS